MRPLYALILAVGLNLAQVASAAAPAGAMLKQISAHSLRGHVSFLASDLLEGRATPSRGLDIAAEYIAAQFRRAGLEPVGDDGYFQTATWGYGSRDMQGFQLRLQIDGSELSVPAEGISLEGGIGLEVDQLAVVRLSRADPALTADSLDGKAVLIDLAPDLSDAARAEARRSIGALLRTAKPLLRIVLDRRNPKGNGGRAPALVDPEDKAAATLSLTLHQPEAVAALAKGERLSMSAKIPGAKLSPVKLRNVIGVLRGSDPVLKDTYVMLTAHYDHLGPVNGKLHRGANDDASGTASVLEIASALAAMPERPKRSLVFMALFGEELGLKGSQYYGRHPVLPLQQTVADLNLEQLGRTDDTEGPQVNRAAVTGFDYSDLGPVLQAAGKATGIEVFKHPVNSDRYFAHSDNQALADVGIPAHTLSVAYGFPDYHGPGDDWHKLDYENMARVNRMVALALLNVANNPQAPQWNGAHPQTGKYVEAARRLNAR